MPCSYRVRLLLYAMNAEGRSASCQLAAMLPVLRLKGDHAAEVGMLHFVNDTPAPPVASVAYCRQQAVLAFPILPFLPSPFPP